MGGNTSKRADEEEKALKEEFERVKAIVDPLVLDDKKNVLSFTLNTLVLEHERIFGKWFELQDGRVQLPAMHVICQRALGLLFAESAMMNLTVTEDGIQGDVPFIHTLWSDKKIANTIRDNFLKDVNRDYTTYVLLEREGKIDPILQWFIGKFDKILATENLTSFSVNPKYVLNLLMSNEKTKSTITELELRGSSAINLYGKHYQAEKKEVEMDTIIVARATSRKRKRIIEGEVTWQGEKVQKVSLEETVKQDKVNLKLLEGKCAMFWSNGRLGCGKNICANSSYYCDTHADKQAGEPPLPSMEPDPKFLAFLKNLPGDNDLRKRMEELKKN